MSHLAARLAPIIPGQPNGSIVEQPYKAHITDTGDRHPVTRDLPGSEQSPPGHYGLSMMRERAETVGALLTVTSQPGRGTELVVRWRETPKQETV